MKIKTIFKRTVDVVYEFCKGLSIGVNLAYRRSDKVLDTLKKMKKFRMKHLGYSETDTDIVNVMLLKQCRTQNACQPYIWEIDLVEQCYLMDEVVKRDSA